jgi:CHAD domain-containing protein
VTAGAPGAGGTARAEGALSAYVRLHARRALDGIEQIGDEELPVEVVHATRTSLRRLRATLRTLPATSPDPVGDDEALQEIALALGAVRDVDVLAELLLPALDAGRPGPDRERAHELLARTLRDRRREAVSALADTARTARWRDGARLLGSWTETPPPTPPLDAAELLARTEQEVERRLAVSRGEPARLHAARKAAKRWRYTAELLADAPGASAALERATRMPELLGEIQDLEIGAGALARLLAESIADGTAEEAEAASESRATGPATDGASRAVLAQLRAALLSRQRGLISAVLA